MYRCHDLGIASLCLIAIAAMGCNKEDFSGLVDKAKNVAMEGKEAVSENVEAAKQKMDSASSGVQEQLNLAGSIKLSVSEPTDACYVNFIPQGSGRPTVLQLQSYREPEQESFPSVFVQAQVEAGSPDELIGTTVEARLFVQPQANGPVLYSENAKPVTLKIMALDDKLLSAELVNAELLNTSTGESVSATGTFDGVLQ